jgi:acetyl-CoA synthetase
MLAVARIGAIHSVIFGGFSADSLRSRIDDAGAKLVITADGGYRKGRVSPSSRPSTRPGDRGEGPQESVEHVLVVRRTENEISWTEGRDIWWHEAVPRHPPSTRRSRSRRRTRCSSSTPRARPESPRAFCTPRAAI